MGAYVKRIPVGKEVVGVTKPTKNAITVPSKKVKAPQAVVFQKQDEKLSPRMTHLTKMAQRYIQQKANAAVTRKAKAVHISKLKDGRKVYVKGITKQTKRSISNPHLKPKTRTVSALKDRTDMMKIVKRLTIDNANKNREEQMKKANSKKKFVPIPYDEPNKSLPALVKEFYGSAPKPKKIVKVTNLAPSANAENLKKSLGRTAQYVNKIAVFAPKKLGKEENTKKMKIAHLKTSSNEMAQAVLRHRGGKVKIGGKKAKMSLIAAKVPPVVHSKAAKERSVKKAASTKALRKANHERHMENLTRAAYRRNRRRHPMHEGPKVLRDRKSGRIYGIKKNPAAKAPEFKRGKVNSYRTMRSMVRATRK